MPYTYTYRCDWWPTARGYALFALSFNRRDRYRVQLHVQAYREKDIG